MTLSHDRQLKQSNTKRVPETNVREPFVVWRYCFGLLEEGIHSRKSCQGHGDGVRKRQYDHPAV